MSKLEQLIKQQQDIANAIEEERAKGRDEAVANVKSLIKQYSITLREVKSVLTMRKPRTHQEAERPSRFIIPISLRTRLQ